MLVLFFYPKVEIHFSSFQLLGDQSTNVHLLFPIVGSDVRRQIHRFTIDVDQMASGIEQALDVPFSPALLKKRADCFSVAASLESYVRLIEERAGRTL